MTPPMTAASIGSVVSTMPVSEKRSTSTDDSPIPRRDASMYSSPKCFHDTRKSGTFMAMTITPTGQCVTALTIIAIPVTPPATISFGNRKA